MFRDHELNDSGARAREKGRTGPYSERFQARYGEGNRFVLLGSRTVEKCELGVTIPVKRCN